MSCLTWWHFLKGQVYGGTCGSFLRISSAKCFWVMWVRNNCLLVLRTWHILQVTVSRWNIGSFLTEFWVSNNGILIYTIGTLNLNEIFFWKISKNLEWMLLLNNFFCRLLWLIASKIWPLLKNMVLILCQIHYFAYFDSFLINSHFWIKGKSTAVLFIISKEKWKNYILICLNKIPLFVKFWHSST